MSTKQKLNEPERGSLADDLLIGCAAIAAELGIGQRQAFHWLQHKLVPAKKVGSVWTTTKTALRRHLEAAS